MKIIRRLAVILACALIFALSFSACGIFSANDADKPHKCEAGALYHNDDKEHWYECRICGKKLEVTEHYKAYNIYDDSWQCVCKYVHHHDFKEEIIAPTCLNYGYIKCACACGDKFNKGFFEELGHDMSEQSYTSATCFEGDYYTFACSRCEHTEKRDGTNPKLEHNYVTYEDKDEATCTKNATQTAHCSLCDTDYEIEVADTALGHSFTSYVAQNDATCTSDGTLLAHCNRCEAVDSRPDEGTKKPHEYSEDWTPSLQHYHYHKCKNCNAGTGNAPHEYEYCCCTDCGYLYAYTNQVTYKKINGQDACSVIKNDYLTDEYVVIRDTYAVSTYEIYPVTRISYFSQTNIKQFRMPDTVTEIYSSAFRKCTNLTSIYISKKLAALEANTFEYCSSLTNIILPASLTSIDCTAFSECRNLEKIYFEGTAEQWNAATEGKTLKYTSGKPYFYSKTKPSASGNYWHYDENDNPVLWEQSAE